MDDLSRRVNEETLDAQAVSKAIQLIIENRFLAEHDSLTDTDQQLDPSRIILKRVELRQGTEIAVFVAPESRVKGCYSVNLGFAWGEEHEHEADVKFETVIDGMTMPNFLVPLRECMVDETVMIRRALNRMGRLEIEDDSPSGESTKVSLLLTIPYADPFQISIPYSELSFFLAPNKTKAVV